MNGISDNKKLNWRLRFGYIRFCTRPSGSSSKVVLLGPADRDNLKSRALVDFAKFVSPAFATWDGGAHLHLCFLIEKFVHVLHQVNVFHSPEVLMLDSLDPQPVLAGG